jgi:hypothetical protein
MHVLEMYYSIFFLVLHKTALSVTLLNCILKAVTLNLPIIVAERSNTLTLIASLRWDRGFRGMAVCVYSVYVVQCLGTGLATG